MTFSPLVLQGGQQKRLQSNEVAETNAPCFRAFRTSDLTLPNNTFTTIAWQSNYFQLGGTWLSGSSPWNFFQVPLAGVYLIGGTIRNFGIGGALEVSVTHNASVNVLNQSIPDNTEGALNQFIYQCAANDYFTVLARQVTGSSKTLPVSSPLGRAPTIWAMRIRG